MSRFTLGEPKRPNWVAIDILNKGLEPMRKFMTYLLGASGLAMAAQAEATNFFFSSGSYVPGVTAPEPLMSPDTLELTTGSNKFWNGVSLTNQTGTVNWQQGSLFMQNGATINNQSLWNATSDNGIFNNGGPLSTFTNSGTFQKSGGIGNTTLSSIAFINSGLIDAQTGTILFNGGNATFNNGSSFTGAGNVNIGANASFNGGFASTNLNFVSGTYTGTGAALTGSADWDAGQISGGWDLTAGSTLNANTGSNKFIGAATLTNDGTINWTGGSLFMQNGSQLINNGTIDAQTSNSINNNGGPLSTFTNNGLFQKTAGASATTIGPIAFVNNGTIDAQAGSIDFNGNDATFNAGSNFTGAGQVNINSNASFNGAFNTANLDFEGGTYTGNAAELTGTADWSAGFFAGAWDVTVGSTLNALSGSNKFLNGAVVTNDGTINWANGALFMQNGSTLINNGTLDAQSNQSLNNNGGPLSTFTNNGLVEKTAGAGTTTIGSIAFVNNGTIDVQTGSIDFNGGNATFNGSSTFNGAGQVNINSNATFNNGFTSANLDFESGTYTGNSAALNGTADWSAGFFQGDWTVAAGSDVTALSGSNKFLNAVNFTNDGTINWAGGALFLQNASQLVNNGLIDYSASSSISNNGGPVSTVINNAAGVISVDAGQSLSISNTLLSNGGTFTADGTINYNGGNATFNTGTSFGGSGTNAINSSAAFNGTFTSTNVDLNGGTFTGNSAVLDGTADWAGGSFSGDWTVDSGSTLNVLSGSNKFLNAASFINDGTVNWSNGALFLQNGSQLVNTGTVAITGNNSINNNGGPASSIVNNGLIQKTAGAGTSTLASGLSLDNNGTINVLSGTIALPSAFSNDGTLGGTGIFTSSTLTNNGSIAPGSPGSTGTLSLTGAFIQGALGTLNSQLASTALSDLFNISGSASLNGTLALSCIFGCAINDGDSFVLLDSIGALSGTFANITTSGFLNGFSYNVIYDYGNDLVRLDVIDAGMAPPAGVPEPASWALMIAGFGLVGSAMRRRTTTRASVMT
jgi:PEP-CTERM motif